MSYIYLFFRKEVPFLDVEGAHLHGAYPWGVGLQGDGCSVVRAGWGLCCTEERPVIWEPREVQVDVGLPENPEPRIWLSSDQSNDSKILQQNVWFGTICSSLQILRERNNEYKKYIAWCISSSTRQTDILINFWLRDIRCTSIAFLAQLAKLIFSLIFGCEFIDVFSCI